MIFLCVVPIDQQETIKVLGIYLKNRKNKMIREKNIPDKDGHRERMIEKLETYQSKDSW